MDDMRQQFEAWCLGKDFSIERYARIGDYTNCLVHWHWEAWQAATKAAQDDCDASIESHVAAAIANEQRACAAIAECEAAGWEYAPDSHNPCASIAAAIRARNTTQEQGT